MKKLSFVYGIIIAICIFWLALLEFDYDHTSNLSSLGLDNNTVSFYFEGDIPHSENERFFDDFLDVISNSNSSIYQAFITEDKYYIYAFSKDKNFIDQIFINDNEVEELINFSTFNNKYLDRNGNIFDPIITYDLRIFPLIDSIDNDYFNLFGTYIINEKDYLLIENDLEILVDGYSDLKLQPQHMSAHSEDRVVSYTDFVILALVIISYLLFLLSSIIKQSTKISLLKQEGYSNLRIYIKYCFKYIIFTSIGTMSRKRRS